MQVRKTVDANVLLQAANLLVMVLLVVEMLRGTSNDYIDASSLALGVALCLQTQVALLIERRRRDPFVVLLVFGLVLYYELRIYTLALFPFSLVFDRYPYDPSDTNYALAFILIANTFMYGGLLGVRLGASRVVQSDEWRASSPIAAIALMVVLFARMYLGGAYALIGSLPRGLAVIQVLLVPDIVVPMALGYYLLFRRTLARQTALAIAALLVIEIAAHTLWGSRGAIPVLVQTILLVALAVNGAVAVSRRLVFLGIALLPLMLVGMIAVFAISTYNRVTREAAGGVTSLDLGKAVSNAREGGTDLLSQSVDIIVPPAVARAGFFDFSAELIAHRHEYRDVMNPSAYVRSVIDNVLTPGFDVFDQPKLSNALRFEYEQEGQPSKIVVDEAYHSDQFGMYGEFYMLFGWSCLPLFFFIPYLLKRLYRRLRGQNPFSLTMKRVVVLFIFVKTLHSFGIDWTIGEILPLIAGMAVYAVFFSSKKLRLGSTGPVAALSSNPPLAPDSR